MDMAQSKKARKNSQVEHSVMILKPGSDSDFDRNLDLIAAQATAHVRALADLYQLLPKSCRMLEDTYLTPMVSLDVMATCWWLARRALDTEREPMPVTYIERKAEAAGMEAVA